MVAVAYAWKIANPPDQIHLEQTQLSRLLLELRKSPLDTSAQNEFLWFIQAARFLRPEQSLRFYNLALKTLAENPGDTRAKTFALEVGRWHYSLQRSDRKLTIYDEQALQNDILVRSS